MVIDFHTHAFSDEIATRAHASLTSKVEGLLIPTHNSTVDGLLRTMNEGGVDISVLLNIVTKPSQTQKVNLWAQSVQSDRLISFGSLYPDDENYKDTIDFICGLGLKGIKLHCEYQSFYVDEDKYLRLYDYALNKGLIIVFHAGVDLGMPEPFHGTPQRFKRVARALGGGNIVVAHLGGHRMWQEVEEHLVGENVYFDTSMGPEYYGEDRLLRVVQAHGADKILFATDSPWGAVASGIAAVKGLQIPDGDKDKILLGNAKRLLKI